MPRTDPPGELDGFLLSLGLAHCTGGADTALPAGSQAIGFYHPTLPRTLQVIGSAAESLRGERASPWDGSPPSCIVLTREVEAAVWQAVADTHHIDCYRAAGSAHETLDLLRQALSLRCAPRQVLHATLVQLYDLGVLLLGASGSGKSELALELVARGHRLVADDAAELSRPAPDCLLGCCPPALEGFIEVRGLGVIDLRAAYGEAAVARRTRVDLAIRVDTVEAAAEPMERLHGRRRTRELLGVNIPEIVLPARLGHNAVMVEAACRDHWLRIGGYVACEAFVHAHDRRIAGPAPD